MSSVVVLTRLRSKTWVVYTIGSPRTPLDFPVLLMPSFLCQRLLGVRPRNRRTSETELTLSMMRPAGREQIKRIDVKIRYSNHSSPLLINSFAGACFGIKREVWMKLDKNVRLRSNWGNGEGDIKLSHDWDEIYPLWRADVLKDWIYELTDLYSEAMQEMGRPYETTLEFVKVEYDNPE